MIQAMQVKKGVPYKETIFLPFPQKNSKVSVPRKWVLKSICGLGIVFLERKKIGFCNFQNNKDNDILRYKHGKSIYNIIVSLTVGFKIFTIIRKKKRH